MTEFTKQAYHLVKNLDNRLYASAYDTAWLAQVGVNGSREPRWHDLIEWLVEHQWDDGSWGGIVPYYHDRILCTLAALIALKKNDSSGQYTHIIQRGEAYIRHNYFQLHCELMDLVGFELIFPTLLSQAYQLGLNIPSHTCGYGAIRDHKLSLLPLELLYKPGSSLAFSLEYMGDSGNLTLLQATQGNQGAIANSPATTAYLSIQSHNQNPSATAYLEAVKARPCGIPAFHPFRTFEVAWVLEHLLFGGFDLKQFSSLPVWDDLQSALTKTGVGIDPTFGINDGDTTSVTLHVLGQMGYELDYRILQHYEIPQKHIFRTFDFERNMSVVTNIHALEAMSLMPDYPQRESIVDKVISVLLSEQKYGSFWVDKWHVSPYYATAHVLIALIRFREYQLVEYSNSIEWLLHTQRQDGSWGFFDRGTYEETAYALLSLLYYHNSGGTVSTDAIKRGMDYLRRGEAMEVVHPELWVAKTLYTPQRIVEAVILATHALYEQIVG